jgi:Metal binding domain of Ada
MVASPAEQIPRYWPSARHFTEVIQCPSVCFSNPILRKTLPAVDRLGMPIVTSGQFAYVYKLKSMNGDGDYAVRCFRGYLGDRDQRYRAIQAHVLKSPVPYLSQFSYSPEGILVGGIRFPILFMQWIDGPTLDLYVSEMLHRRDVLLHLAGEWLRVVGAFQTAGIAHGDLQHGNVIVEHGQLRLIDHDGIFVPTMGGWAACEVGHQHYQHPQRSAEQFDAGLDNFSSLVIYLSLLALAERPSLWEEYHDENLLFTKADFLDPSNSTLFAKVREIGAEQSRLADVLADASVGSPSAVPRLADLVQAPSRLPSWMHAPIDLETTTKTREVVRIDPLANNRGVRWIPWQEKQKESSLPSTPSSSTFQTIFSGGTVAPSARRNPDAIALNTLHFAKESFRGHFFWWYWAVYLLFQFGALGAGFSLLAAILCVTIACLVYGLYRAIEESRGAQRLGPLSQRSGALPPITGRQNPAAWHSGPPLPLPQPLAQTPSPVALPRTRFIGNRVLGIYHARNCDWVHQISAANIVGFKSTTEASSHGYKPCRICSPAT